MTSILYIIKPFITIVYYIIYCLITIPLFLTLHSTNQIHITQFNKLNIISPILQLFIPIILLSLRGIPPLTGFIPKWLVIYSLCEYAPIILIILICGAIINTYFYINIIFNSILSFNIYSIHYKHNKLTTKSIIILSTLTLFLTPLVLL